VVAAEPRLEVGSTAGPDTEAVRIAAVGTVGIAAAAQVAGTRLEVSEALGIEGWGTEGRTAAAFVLRWPGSSWRDRASCWVETAQAEKSAQPQEAVLL